VMMVTGERGQKVTSYSYDAYGRLMGGKFGRVSDLGYTGKKVDPVTGWYDYGYRDYATMTMRFTTVDPIRSGANWYAYVGGDPVNYVDPLGLQESDGVAAGAVGSDPYAHMVSGRAYAPGAGTAYVYPVASQSNPNSANREYGNTVIIVHDNGYISGLAHLASFSVQNGQRVEQGQEIGVIGATTTSPDLLAIPMEEHLHWAVMEDVTQASSTAYYSDSYFWENQPARRLELRIEVYESMYDDNAAVAALRRFVDPETLVESGAMIHPANTRITSAYGPRDLPGFEDHYGVDYSASEVAR